MVWWKGKQKRRTKVDVLKDTGAILEFLDDIQADINFLKPLLKQLKELEKEQKVASDKLKPTNIKTQARLIDKMMERYEFFESDVSINGIRLKMVAEELLVDAKKHDLVKFAKQKKKDWKIN